MYGDQIGKSDMYSSVVIGGKFFVSRKANFSELDNYFQNTSSISSLAIKA